MVLLTLAAVIVALGLSIHLGPFSSEVEALPGRALPISLSSERLDFGIVPLNGAAMRQLVLRNDGSDPVEARLEVGRAYAVRPSELILHPGISTRVEVSVRAERPGSLDDELRIRFGEPDATPLVVGLAGQATGDTAEGPATEPPAAQRPRSTEVAAFVPAGIARNEQSGRGGATADPRAAETRFAEGSPVTAAQARAGIASGLQVAERTRSAGAPGGSEAGEDRGAGPARDSRDIGVRVGEAVTPGRGASMAERPPPIPDTISPVEAGRARELSSKVPGGGAGPLPDRLPDDAGGGSDDWDDDVFDDEDDPGQEPFQSPTLEISHVSLIGLMGSNTTFYPQQVGVVGAPTGGALGLSSEILFPQIALAFGESVAFKQTGPVSGTFDAATGSVTLDLPITAIDSDGHAAPLPQFQLTTGTSVERNSQGIVVALTGAPRDPVSGLLKLVAMRQIPVGYSNSAEQQLVQMEILAALDFGTAATGPAGRPALGRN